MKYFLENFDQRHELGKVMMQRHNNNTFCLNVCVSMQNIRYWAQENPHWMLEVHFLLNTAKYLKLLQNEIITALVTQYRIKNPSYSRCFIILSV